MAEPACTIVLEGIGSNMYPQGPTFHWRDGWYFCRGEGLVVNIWNDGHDIHLEIPRDEWDSIVETLEQ